MIRFLDNLTNTGTDFHQSPSARRGLFLSNAISLIVATLAFLLFIVYYLWYGWSTITFAIPVIGVFCLVPLVFNSINLSGIGRIWVCLFIPVATLTLSVFAKIENYQNQEELDYFTFRIIILSSCVFPPVFFSIREKRNLAITSLLILAVLLMHDPVHNFFGVPYRPTFMGNTNYGFTNVVFIAVYLLMTGTVLFMKWVSESTEEKAHALILELNKTNRKLTDKNNETELQNEEIRRQAESLNSGRQKLGDAYKIIEEQRNLLYRQNKYLSTELIEKNKELVETNHELIKHNNELRQFSFTVSHNLRGPVASLMGLLKLFEMTDLSAENLEIYKHIESSTERLDMIIRDLSKIIDIRHDIFHIRQQIVLSGEMHEIEQVLKREIETQQITLLTNFSEARIIYSVRPMVHSILYNLVSNAIKYRAKDRPAIVEVTTSEDNQFYYIRVRDNGLGIDLQRDQDNLFKLYKRFHHHTEGKGLGLYLVKLQAEALGGGITVESEVNRYTLFTVKLKKPVNAERQLLYHEEDAEIFYDARLNSIGTIWNKPVNQAEYQLVLKKLIDFIQVYNTPNYISGPFVKGGMSAGERAATFVTIIPEAARHGLKRLAVTFEETLPDELVKEVKSKLSKMGVEIEVFHKLENAIYWIESKNVHTDPVKR